MNKYIRIYYIDTLKRRRCCFPTINCRGKGRSVKDDLFKVVDREVCPILIQMSSNYKIFIEHINKVRLSSKSIERKTDQNKSFA